MSAYYSVLQYVPDPVTDERVNFGVVVFGEKRVRTRITNNWNRVKQFGPGDIDFLKDFAEDLAEEAQRVQLSLFERGETIEWQEEAVRRLAGRWINSIQITEPRASLKSAADLIEEVAITFLKERKTKPRGKRDKRAIVNTTYGKLKVKLEQRVGPRASDFLSRHAPVQGRVETHHFDIVVKNGSVFFAAQGLSFEVGDDKRSTMELEATAWAIDDVRQSDAEVPLAVVFLPPKDRTGGREAYARAQKIFPKLHATLVPESDIDEWAGRVVANVQL